ncbi:HNH endonuclease [Calidifontibacillus erzurumensis]|uniref:HNH endonuclease n=1 Tax=Calidifontibacillus erzurumensis TaxID=2741433 RepID=A0A8J8KBK4_9BACI|nr:HNH endonuclease [Calidifontibacillus erzurumensis]NSL51712.1 HNH endonuclease [Calidifontibacillus erzurumensis]
MCTTNNEETRQCRICGQIKPLDQFEKDKRQPGGITNRCAACKYSYYETLRGRANRAYHNAKERAEKFGVKNDLSFEQVIKLFEVFDGCSYCGCLESDGEPIELEHIVSMSRGGANSLDNVLRACRRCNTRKSDKPLVTFFLENEEFTDDHMAGIIYYLSMMRGVPKEQVIAELVDAHAHYTAEMMFKQLDREMKIANEQVG